MTLSPITSSFLIVIWYPKVIFCFLKMPSVPSFLYGYEAVDDAMLLGTKSFCHSYVLSLKSSAVHTQFNCAFNFFKHDPRCCDHTLLCILLVLSPLVVSDSVIPWTVAHQASLSIGLFRQEYWSGLPFPSPGDLPNPAIKLASPALADRFFILSHLGSPCFCVYETIFYDNVYVEKTMR